MHPVSYHSSCIHSLLKFGFIVLNIGKEMPQLNGKQRIEISMMIGWGDRVRTQQEVCDIFNAKYPERLTVNGQ